MEIQTKINTDRHLRKHKIVGVIDVPELRKMLRGYYESPEFDMTMNAIWDLSAADFSQVSTDQVRTLAEMVYHFWGQAGQSKSALVVTRDLDYGLSRMYEMLVAKSDKSQVRVFKKMDDAERWVKQAE